MSIRKQIGCAFLCAFVSLRAQEAPPECGGGEDFQFEVQVSLDGGQSWYPNFVPILAYPGSTVDIALRTMLTVATGETQGWSFSLRHDASGLYDFMGNVTVTGVTTEGTDTEIVQGGNPPDFESTDIADALNGYTHGVVIDTEQQLTLPPTAGFVTSLACYQIDVPLYSGAYLVPVMFTHDLGDPPIDSIVVQGGFGYEPCARNMILQIYAGNFNLNYPPCSVQGGGSGGSSPQSSPGAEGGPQAGQGSNQIAYTRPVPYQVSEAANPIITAVEAGDLDGDGYPDLIATKTTERAMVILWNDGEGDFSQRAPAEITIDYDPDNGFARVVSIALDDLDGKHGIDIVVLWDAAAQERKENDAACVLWNKGEPPYFSVDPADRVYLPLGGLRDRPDSIAVGDVIEFVGDEQKQKDIIVGGTNEGIQNPGDYLVVINKKSFREFGAPRVDYHPEVLGFEHIKVAEIKGTKPLEEIVGKSGAIAYGDESQWPKNIDAGFFVPEDTGKHDLGDLNGDTYLDFVSANLNESLINICKNVVVNGERTFQGCQVSELRQNRAVAVTDMENDGNLDIAVALMKLDQELGPPISLRRNTGSGSICDEERWESVGTVETQYGRIEHLGCADLNGDNKEDLFCSTVTGYVLLIFNEYGPPFRRGDTNNDGSINIADAVAILMYLFVEGSIPSCLDAADANDDGDINIADAIYVLQYLFGAGPEPPEPFGQCGRDPTWDKLQCVESNCQ